MDFETVESFLIPIGLDFKSPSEDPKNNSRAPVLRGAGSRGLTSRSTKKWAEKSLAKKWIENGHTEGTSFCHQFFCQHS
jgi:hypothetical protein